MVIGYCRVSRLDTDSDALMNQEQQIKNYCESKTYRLDNLFSEVGSSQDSQRPEYVKMLDLLKGYTCCKIVVTDIDRITRSSVELGLFQELCKKNKHTVELTTGSVNNFDDYTTVFTSSIVGAVSQYLYSQTRSKMERGRKISQAGGMFMGKTPLGYKRKNKKLEVEPATADIVRDIFKRIIAGDSTGEVARYLNSNGIMTGEGNSWDSRSIRNIVKNKGYTGTIVNNNVYPAIITESDYLKANSMLKNLNNNGNRRSYSLSNKIYCSNCGTKLVITYKTDRGTAVLTSCVTSNKNRGSDIPQCSCTGCSYSLVESAVKSDCLAYIENLLAEKYQMLTADKKLLTSHEDNIVKIDIELKEEQQKLSRINNLYVLGNIDSLQLEEMSTDIKSRIALLELQEKELKSYSLFKIVEKLQAEIVYLEELLNSQDMNELSKLVDRVMYYKQGKGSSPDVQTIFK